MTQLNRHHALRLVEKKPAKPKDRQVRDALIPELKRRTRGDYETWVLRLLEGGRRRMVTLGECSHMSLDRARALAADMLSV